MDAHDSRKRQGAGSSDANAPWETVDAELVQDEVVDAEAAQSDVVDAERVQDRVVDAERVQDRVVDAERVQDEVVDAGLVRDQVVDAGLVSDKVPDVTMLHPNPSEPDIRQANGGSGVVSGINAKPVKTVISQKPVEPKEKGLYLTLWPALVAIMVVLLGSLLLLSLVFGGTDALKSIGDKLDGETMDGPTAAPRESSPDAETPPSSLITPASLVQGGGYAYVIFGDVPESDSSFGEMPFHILNSSQDEVTVVSPRVEAAKLRDYVAQPDGTVFETSMEEGAINTLIANNRFDSPESDEHAPEGNEVIPGVLTYDELVRAGGTGCDDLYCVYTMASNRCTAFYEDSTSISYGLRYNPTDSEQSLAELIQRNCEQWPREAAFNQDSLRKTLLRSLSLAAKCAHPDAPVRPSVSTDVCELPEFRALSGFVDSVLVPKMRDQYYGALYHAGIFAFEKDVVSGSDWSVGEQTFEVNGAYFRHAWTQVTQSGEKRQWFVRYASLEEAMSARFGVD